MHSVLSALHRLFFREESSKRPQSLRTLASTHSTEQISVGWSSFPLLGGLAAGELQDKAGEWRDRRNLCWDLEWSLTFLLCLWLRSLLLTSTLVYGRSPVYFTRTWRNWSPWHMPSEGFSCPACSVEIPENSISSDYLSFQEGLGAHLPVLKTTLFLAFLQLFFLHENYML